MLVQVAPLTRFDRVLLSLLAFFCLSETSLEMVFSDSQEDIAAVLLAKATWMALIAGTFMQRRYAARLLSYLCVVSAIAVGLSLPDMASKAPFFFLILTIDVLLKFSMFVRVAVVSSHPIDP
ncbi:hypothetical protein [Paraburkholderia sp. BR14320]|uniref:hypothetical protein n=1 Tax=unclassified Paraburkholderia TaxID=2615204 RepID=UPI0034CDEB2E